MKWGSLCKAHLAGSGNGNGMNVILRLILIRFLAYLAFLKVRTLHVQWDASGFGKSFQSLRRTPLPLLNALLALWVSAVLRWGLHLHSRHSSSAVLEGAFPSALVARSCTVLMTGSTIWVMFNHILARSEWIQVMEFLTILFDFTPS